MSLTYIIHIICGCIFAQLDFQPADIKHSSFRTMAKHVRRAMLPGNDTVYKKSFAKGKKYLLLPAYCAFPGLRRCSGTRGQWAACRGGGLGPRAIPARRVAIERVGEGSDRLQTSTAPRLNRAPTRTAIEPEKRFAAGCTPQAGPTPGGSRTLSGAAKHRAPLKVFRVCVVG